MCACAYKKGKYKNVIHISTQYKNVKLQFQSVITTLSQPAKRVYKSPSSITITATIHILLTTSDRIRTRKGIICV